MALQFILGDLRANKKKIIMNQLLKLKQSNPQAIIYYLVPEHLKFDMESELLQAIQSQNQRQESTMIDIQVASFTRLAWFMMPKSYQNRQIISDIGLNMLVRNLLKKHKDSLYTFRNQINKNGFIEKLLAFFEELYENKIAAEDLTDYRLDKTYSLPFESLDDQKNYELAMLYQEFCQLIEKEQLEDYQWVNDFKAFLQAKDQLNNHYLVIDHHYYFNSQELELLQEFIRLFDQVWISLPIEPQDLREENWNPLFATQKKTYNQMKALIDPDYLDEDWVIDGPNYSYHADILLFAERFKSSFTIGIAPQAQQVNPIQKIECWKNESLQVEIEHLANEITHLVSEQNYHYRDILILTKDLDRYQSIVQSIFKQEEIPFFYDHERSMSHHPLVLLIESLLSLFKYQWQYDDLMLVLKSPLLLPKTLRAKVAATSDQKVKERLYQNHRRDLDIFENIVLANNYSSYRLTEESFEWSFDQEDLRVVDHLGQATNKTYGQLATDFRHWLVHSIHQPFQGFWKKKSISGKEAVQWFYQLIQKLGIKEQLELIRDHKIEKGQIEESVNDEQVWQLFTQLLDEFYQLYGDDALTFDEFYDLLITGLKNGKYHIAPPSLDKVTVSSILSPQIKPYPIVFILGLDEQTFPTQIQDQSLISETERQAINTRLQHKQENYKQLVNPNERNYHLESLTAYQLLLLATDHLYLSYAMVNDKEILRISPYYHQLIENLKIPLYTMHKNINLTDNQMIHSSYFGKGKSMVSLALNNIRSFYEEGLMPPKSLFSFLHLIDKDYYGGSFKSFISKVLHFNHLPKNLSSQTAQLLFGKNLNLSVSKVEQYYQDPYSHFLLYGLKLKERQNYEVNSRNIGDYFHDYLDLFVKYLIEEGIDLRQIGYKQLDKLNQRTIDLLNREDKFKIFNSHPRLKAINYQMLKRLESFISFIQKQLSLIKMTPVQTEVIFGLSRGESLLEGLTYPLDSGGQLTISGKIDRIDIDEQEKLLQVIDYKSGPKKFDLVDVYYGLDLQILTYLSIALQNYSDYQAVGGFYQPILQKVLSAEEDTLEPEHYDSLSLSKNRLNGFITVSPEELMAIEPQFEELNNSQVYPARLLKSGKYSKSTEVFTDEELYLLLTYTHHLFKQAANQIQAGQIELKPFKSEIYTPSIQKEYRPITAFDATEHYNVYREKTIKKHQVLAEIESILSQQEEEDPK